MQLQHFLVVQQSMKSLRSNEKSSKKEIETQLKKGVVYNNDMVY